MVPIWIGPKEKGDGVTVKNGAAVLYWFCVKSADTDSEALIVTTQLPLPVHAPDHPENEYPFEATGVNVTDVPSMKLAAH